MKACLSFLFLFSTVFGALPPLSQSVKELQALLADSHIQDIGSAEPILEIVKIDNGYLVITQSYTMQVDVVYKPMDQKKVGPVQFQLQFHQPVVTTRGNDEMDDD